MEVWAEAREVLEPMFDRVFTGEPVSIEDFSLGLDRQGRIEEAHFEFAYTPARGEDGSVEKPFGACIETTARVMAERRQAEHTERQRRQFQCAPGFIRYHVATATSRLFAAGSSPFTILTSVFQERAAMAELHVMSALRNKRAELAGTVSRLEPCLSG